MLYWRKSQVAITKIAYLSDKHKSVKLFLSKNFCASGSL